MSFLYFVLPTGRMRCIFSAFLFFSALLPARLATAQTSDTVSNSDTLPRSEWRIQQAVVIQANRASSLSAVPHVNLKTADLRRVYHAQDIPYLLASTPSLVESSDAGTGIGYTGMRIRGADPTRINVTINGVPLNDAESQAVFWVNLPDLAASATEIQVQRGVGSSTNGAGAFGATVNIDISQVSAEPFAELSGTVGSFNTQKFSARAGTGLIDGHWAFSGRLSRVHSDGYIDRASADLDALHLHGAFIGDRQSVQLHVLSGRETTYQAWYAVPAQYIDDPELRTYNVAGTEKPGEPYPDESDNYRQTHHLAHYKRLLNPFLQLQLNGHYTRGKGYFEQYKAGQALSDYGVPPGTEDTTDLIRRLWLDNHFFGTTFALLWKPGVNPPFLARGPEFMLGGAASRYEGTHFGDVIWAEYAETLPKDYRYYENEAQKTDANLFGKIDLHFRNQWSAMLDLQYRSVHYAFLGFDNDLNNVTQDATLHFFNPKVGANWSASKDLQVYFFAGIGNREPNRDDYTQSTPDSRPRPERLYNLESGIRWKQAAWRASANLFYMYYRDQLVLDGRLNDVGAYIRTNVPRSHRTGIELEGTGMPAERIRVSANLSLSRNHIDAFTEYRDNWDTGAQEAFTWNNTPIAYSPDLVARAEAGFMFWKKKAHQAEVSIAGKYVGKQYLDNTGNENTVLPAFGYGDLRLNYDWAPTQRGQQLSVIFTVHNLFNAAYSNNGWTYRYTSQGFDETPFNPYARAEGNGVYNQTGFFAQAGRHVMGTVVWAIGR
ncbi:MAG: TonB-dependent receptor [Saprospiraceae bacterium]|nr:TonB-dependent receptor [Saprospiraceae bacterium]